ncbi:HpcH/HpaI aldolase/citrate lyase family protein [Pantoea sp. 18069]|uniref:HpcH/HpaI aldolase family protein n=1 Tax=Pantoea sp. 18069 TaxID=2681415 RepID=UPI00135BBF60|nr:aldolase/citrate lyase family protein [Pantoea sp. 18069]
MRENSLIALKAAGKMALNAWVSVGCGYQAELLGHAGFDAVTVDLQHGPYGFDTAVHLLQAISSTPAMPMARSAGSTLAEIHKLLDAGAYGIICPLIESVDDAAAFARACRYPPRGDRSFGPARGLTYGGSDYAAGADDQIFSLAMIETLSALDCIEQIAQVQELSGVYVGPSDLGLAMGLGSSAWPQPALVDAIRHVLEVCRAQGKYTGIYSSSLAMDQAMREMGFDLVTPGNDAQQLRAGAQQRIQPLRAI